MQATKLGARLPRVVDSVYFGGGTPSLLEPKQLRAIFASLRRQFVIAEDAELTLEAAPGQIQDDLLEEALQQGINRVSLGVQSFIERESTAVGRSHTGEMCLKEIARLHSQSIAEVGADLIAGLPYQTHESWRASLETACASDLTHLSVYLLEIDEGSRLGREVLNGGARLHAPAVASEELAAEFYEEACEFLRTHGFSQYEISNFARCDENAPWLHQSRHNRKYWERSPYIGFGLDAHSMLECLHGTDVRFANPKELALYESDLRKPEVLEIGEREAFEEAIFLGLRLNEGVAVHALRNRFARAWVDQCEMQVKRLAAEGMMSIDGERWKLTLQGRLLANEVLGELLMDSFVSA